MVKLLSSQIAQLSAFIFLGITGFTQSGHGTDYVVQKTFQVGGEGGFDYVTLDDNGKALYLPRTTHTEVVDASTGKVLQIFRTTRGPTASHWCHR